LNALIQAVGAKTATILTASAITLALAAGGCGGSGPGMAPVSGVVTYQGKPVPKGTITFVPLAKEGRNAIGELDSQGHYTLQTEEPGDGALLGDYQVTIAAREDPILDYIPKKPVKPKLLVPEKYGKPDTSGLKATVKSGNNDIPFDLE
jgi:hypothetical protein